MKTRLIKFVSWATVSCAIGGMALAQEQQAPSGGTFIPPKLSLPAPGLQQPVSAGIFILPKILPTLPLPRNGRSAATTAEPQKCAVPLLEMKPQPFSDANTIAPRPTQDPMAVKPPAPACAPAARK